MLTEATVFSFAIEYYNISAVDILLIYCLAYPNQVEQLLMFRI